MTWALVCLTKVDFVSVESSQWFRYFESVIRQVVRYLYRM